MNITYLVSLMSENTVTFVFGNIMLAGIFLFFIMLFMCWKFDIPADGVLVIMGFGTLTIAGGLLLPSPDIFKMFIFLGILAGIGFVVYARFFRA